MGKAQGDLLFQGICIGGCCMNKRNIKSSIIAILIVNLLFLPIYPGINAIALGADLSSIYNSMKNKPENSVFLNRLHAAGATEMDIETFLIDLNQAVNSSGPLTEENFDRQLYDAMRKVLTWEEHSAMFDALLEAFPDEIDYTLENNELHPSLVPLRNAVKDAVFQQTTPQNPGAGGGGGGGGLVPVTPKPDPEKEKKEPAKEQTKPAPAEPAAISFKDLDGHWASQSIQTLVGMKLVAGVTAEYFEPDRKISRAEFTALLIRALNLPANTVIRGQYEDVPADAWYFNYVNTAAQAGLVSGFSEKRFAPNAGITREQMAVMISRALAYKGHNLQAGEEKLSIFSDKGSISPWARSGVASAVANGIVKGCGDGSFAPSASATRAEASVMILHLHQIL